jgi:hypothetical protein
MSSDLRYAVAGSLSADRLRVQGFIATLRRVLVMVISRRVGLCSIRLDSGDERTPVRRDRPAE